MITREFLDNAIDNMVDRFDRDNGYINRAYKQTILDENGNGCSIMFYVDREMELLFQVLNVEHRIECIMAYENLDFAIYVLTIAYICPEDNKLHTRNFIVELHNKEV